MRVIKHPILDELDTSARVTIYYNGQPVEALEGEPIAAALINAGITAFRTTQKRHEPRGIFCAIGRCNGHCVGHLVASPLIAGQFPTEHRRSGIDAQRGNESTHARAHHFEASFHADGQKEEKQQ